MFKIRLFGIAFLLCSCFFSAFSQKKVDPTHIGTAKGIARDTAQNYVLKSATVSIYKAVDSAIVSYQVTNNYGEFSFKNLPLNIALRLEITSIGYATTRKSFILSTGTNSIDLGTLVVNRKDIMLDDVEITIPPMSVNGDTLEFNAAAFKLDTNATVEDMLKVLPNVTLWGDGQITVNGAEVKSLKVNGKSFFGGDVKVAIQNISKNALQKVQVYNTVKDKSNPLDSTLEMNLKLKKGKDVGYFGKIGFGYGTNNRFETDASINMYTPKMQVALIGAMNNINKTPNSVSSLMQNSTFKGVGTNVEYQPDFRASGVNRPSAFGGSFTYNFIDKPTYELKNTLNANYFLQDKKSDFLSETQTTTSVNASEKIIENSNTINSANNNVQRFDSRYEYAKKGHNINFSQATNINNGESTDQTFRTARNQQNELTSTNNSMGTNKYQNNNFTLRGGYQYSPYFITENTRFRGFNLDYDLNVYDNNSQRQNITDFRSFTGAVSNQKFNRKYDSEGTGIKHQIDFTLPDLKSVLLGNKQFAGIDVEITNKIIVRSDKNDNKAEDLDTLTNIYRSNAYLSNVVQTDVIEETPGLRIGKSFSKSLSNRFYQSLSLSFHPKQLLINQNNKSDRAFQNIKRSYSTFLPDASVRYYDNQYGEYSRSYSLDFATTVTIPNVQQLAPLTDSTNLYYLQRGNVNLRQSIRRQLSLSFNNYDQTNKNTLNYNLNVSFGMINNNIVDSLLIDEQNRRTVFLVNADGNRFINGYGNVRKAYKFKSSEIQISVNGGFDVNRNPGYTNSVFTFASNFNTNSRANIDYTYKSSLAVALGQSFNTYSSKQEAFNTKYNGANLGTSASASYNFNKKLTMSSNVTFNNASSSGAKDINFTIWNANLIYRFLKGNNAEVKFSALDLLHQNSSVINYGNSNSFTIGTQNVLKQYFMTTLSYYPRQFGKKAGKK